MINVVLIGAGGHSKVIRDIINAKDGLNLYAVLDQSFKNKEIIDNIIFGKTELITDLLKTECKFCIAIGNNTIRQKLSLDFDIPLNRYVSLIHPSAVVSPSAAIGKGTVVMPNAVVNADAFIGKHCIINSGAIIEHDNRLGDFVHVSPNSTLAGNVTIGNGTHVGAGATVIPMKKIGEWSIIGAGAVLTNEIGNRITVTGIPAKPQK